MSSGPSETSPLLLLSTGSSSLSLKESEPLRARLKKAAGGDGKLQTSEFQRLLLELGVVRVKSAVVQDIFVASDADGDGGLTVDELLDYVENLEPQTFQDALVYTLQQTTSSIVWWFAVAFHFAAWVGVVSYIYSLEGKSIRAEWKIVGAWFFFCGAVYFFKLLLDAETSAYDTAIQAKLILQKAVQQDPAFFHQTAGTDGRLDLYELNAALEEHGLYVPKTIVKQIFQEIDTDGGGVITEDEILQFAKTAKTNPTPEERQAAIQQAVVRTWGFWSLLCWFIGSILFLVGAHLSYAGVLEPPLPKNTYLHLYGMGSVLYWLLAVCMLPMIHREVTEYLESIQQMCKAFADRSERSRHNNGETEKETKTNDKDEIAHSFRSLDVHADGNLDASELYEALMEEGVLIPYDTLLELFHAADVSGDGQLQLDEFTDFIANLHVSQDPWMYRWQFLQRVPWTSCFFGWLMFFIGGVFYTMGSYVDLADSAGWYFAGAICYGMASAKNVFGTIWGHYKHFQAVEAGKAAFKARILVVESVPQIV